MTEYSNGELLNKTLLDLDIDPTATYTAGNKQDVDIAKAYVLQVAAYAPDFSEGSMRIAWSSAALLAEANRIFKKYGITTEGTGAQIDGTSQW